MLTELRVRDLGVIDDVTVELSDGMTALTGETGAGKTLVVGALSLLLGGRADPVLVRPGASQALVEGRFLDGAGNEVILARAIPARGRSRAWINGLMATLPELTALGATLVDVHGQHAQQSLFTAPGQRSALDEFANVDLKPLRAARDQVRLLTGQLDSLGGDPNLRAREVNLLEFQIGEIDAAKITGPNEDELLAAEEERLASVASLRELAAQAAHLLDSAPQGNVVDLLGETSAALGHRPAFDDLAARCEAATAELQDVAAELRRIADTWEEDPLRLEAVTSRRHLFATLRRKYGGTLGEILAFREASAAQLAELLSADDRVRVLSVERDVARAEVRRHEAVVGDSRRKAAGPLGAAITRHLQDLAMPRATLRIEVGQEDPGDDVTFLLAANSGERALPLAKVASGGELARTMLAIRLVLTTAPGTLVFDEVDAGVGGEAAVAVGAALARLAQAHQVLVVTHLPQVAAFADHQLAVRKTSAGMRTISTVQVLDQENRVVELARMLSGKPDSDTARQHARELLAGIAPPNPSASSTVSECR
jgi:DNA repair protein RecN (Recombination protein N)